MKFSAIILALCLGASSAFVRTSTLPRVSRAIQSSAISMVSCCKCMTTTTGLVEPEAGIPTGLCACCQPREKERPHATPARARRRLSSSAHVGCRRSILIVEGLRRGRRRRRRVLQTHPTHRAHSPSPPPPPLGNVELPDACGRQDPGRQGRLRLRHAGAHLEAPGGQEDHSSRPPGRLHSHVIFNPDPRVP